MHIESLKLFCDVVQYSSFSKAAKNNGITQSTISQTINNLEKQLEVILIDRSLRPWKLTSDGHIFYEGCRLIVEDFFQLKNSVKQNHEEISSLIQIASIYSVGLKQMKQSINLFANINGAVKIELKYLHSSSVYESVINDEVDFGIISFPKPQRELVISPWKEEQMVLVCPPEHRLSRQKVIAPQQISGEKFIGFSKNMEIRKQTDRFLNHHDINIEINLEFDNIESIKRAVEISSGISILPEPTITSEIDTGLLIGIPFIHNEFTRPIGIIHRRGKILNQSVLSFIDFLKTRDE
ncbi:MAG: LysR family transcriptional regulator [Spirochaetaceae bacterium]|nr:LysR family transcriptional regulator [Spirochaetaceae bacterium]